MLHPRSVLAAVVLSLVAVAQAGSQTDDDTKKKLEDFKTAIRDKDESARVTAIGALAQAFSPEVTKALTPYLTSDTESVRVAAAQALARPADDVAISALSGAIGSNQKSATVLKAIAKALGDCNSEKALPALHGLFPHYAEDVASEAVAAVGKIADPQSIEPLMQLLRRAVSDIQDSGLVGKGGSSPPRNKDLDALAQPVEQALGSITNGSGSNYKDWQKWLKENQAGLRYNLVFWCPGKRETFELKPGEPRKCKVDGESTKCTPVFLKQHVASK